MTCERSDISRVPILLVAAVTVAALGCGPERTPKVWVALSVGSSHTYAVAADGELLCWG